MPERKHKILFCTPPARPSGEKFNAFTEGGSAFPSLGLLILAALARTRGHEVVFRDFLNSGDRASRAVSEIAGMAPDWILISSNTDMILAASDLARDMKRTAGRYTVIVGGPHMSAVPGETMGQCPDFDIGVIGEGERTFCELLEKGIGPESLSSVNGIVFREGGRITVNAPRPFIGDLDTLPFPAWDLIPDMRLYRPAVTNFLREPVFSVMTSRGCFGRCIFCDRGVFGNTVRLHSARYVLDMIRELTTRFGVREITFYDDNMVFDKKRLLDICQGLSAERAPVTWSCSARVDRVDEETLVCMKKAGCWQISYGIESGSPEILKNIRKGITVEQIREAARLTKKAGMSMRGYFIIGNPGETEATLKQSLALALTLPFDDILVEYMTPYPGTDLYRDIGRYGAMKGDWSTLNSYGMNFVPHGLDGKILEEYFYRFYKSFYLRPRQIVSYCRRLKNPRKIAGLGLKYLNFVGNGRRDHGRCAV